MELRQLRHFVAVVRLASMSAAAEQLGLTQPALSKSNRILEQSLGVRLLDRGPTGVRMTLFGERLKGYADLVLALSDEAVEEIDALRVHGMGVFGSAAWRRCYVRSFHGLSLHLRTFTRMWTSSSVRGSTIPSSTHCAAVASISPSRCARRVRAILT